MPLGCLLRVNLSLPNAHTSLPTLDVIMHKTSGNGLEICGEMVVPTNPAKRVLHCTTATNEKSKDELMCNKRIALNMRQSSQQS